MTPEQLEAHRMRFEQQFAKANGLPCSDFVRLQRHGENYGPMSHWNSAWQAYQWAIADADRAQRAAPVSEVQAEKNRRSADKQSRIEVGKRINDLLVLIDRYAGQRGGREIDDPYRKHLRDEVVKSLRDFLATPQPVEVSFANRVMDAAGNLVHVSTLTQQSAQPVEVQRVPLTDAQVEDLRADANRGYCIERDEYFKAFRDAEQAHGIKPTGEAKS